MGESDEACALLERAAETIKTSGHAGQQAMTVATLVLEYVRRGGLERARTWCAELDGVNDDRRRNRHLVATHFAAGDVTGAIEELRASLNAVATTGGTFALPWLLESFAEVAIATEHMEVVGAVARGCRSWPRRVRMRARGLVARRERARTRFRSATGPGRAVAGGARR